MVNRIDSDVTIDGALNATTLGATTASITNAMCTSTMALARSKLAQDTIQPFTIPFTDLRVHDAVATVLPGTPAADDLGLDSGSAFGTEHMHVTAGDIKTTSSTRYARFMCALPAEYDDGETVNIRVHAGMLTTVADGSCTCDIECYSADKDTTVSADLCSTAAQSMNSLTFSDLTYTITATSLVSGTWLDVRVSVIYADTATGTAVEPVIGAIQLLCDIKG